MSSDKGTPLVQLEGVGKRYGNIIALRDIDLEVAAHEITCVLGDNGAGKSTLIKIVAGLHKHDEGVFRVAGEPVSFGSPREALERGIATVYQDLAVVPLMPVWRNFFLGSEKRVGRGPLKRLDIGFMRATAKRELLDMGIDLRDVDQPIGTLSGGERQCVAIARAVYFGAKVLILDEPTAALDAVAEAEVFSNFADLTRERMAILISHRFSTVRLADRIVVLAEGRITEDGSHDQLIASRGRYARLFEMQAANYR
jgi:simple sugar transport system ATP-binding protein